MGRANESHGQEDERARALRVHAKHQNGPHTEEDQKQLNEPGFRPDPPMKTGYEVGETDVQEACCR